MKKEEFKTDRQEYRLPAVKTIEVAVSTIICNSDEQIQPYQDDEDQFRF